MDILNVTFGPPVLTTSPVAMFISTQTTYWPNRLSALMYELMPCVFHPAQSIYEGSLSDLEYLERRCKEMSVQLNVDYSYIQAPEQKVADTSTKFEYKTKPFEHQIVAVEFGMEHDRFLLADEMGCVSGDTLVSYNYCGNSNKKTISWLYDFYHRCKFPDKFKVRSLLGDHFGLNPIENIVYSGKKAVYQITTVSGKLLKATADHEIYTPNGYIELQNLSVNDKIYTNGNLVCSICGSVENVITNKYAKFYGYCRKCMFKHRDLAKYKGEEIHRFKKRDGYIYLRGDKVRFSPNYTTSGIQEHVYVMEQHLGRFLQKGEVVHHKDGDKTNNAIENLQLCSSVKDHLSEHSLVSNFYKNFTRKDGTEIIMVPKEDTIIDISYIGVEDTYDIICASEYHNFIANGIVVHNCGKTKSTIDLGVRKKIEKGYKHCLIICGVNGLKYNWESEIKVHSNEKCLILGNRQNSKGKWNVKSSAEKLEDAKNIPDDVYFIITNVETLRNKEIAKALKQQCDNNNINMIAFDEFHMVTTPDAQQSKGLLKLSAESMVAMTGSPIMNSPLDIYMTLRWLGYDRHCFSDFKNQFCRFGANNEIVGVKNMDQIQNILKIMMLRRRKEDVLDLPEKLYKVEYVEMSAAQQRIYNEVVNNLRKEVDLIRQSKNPLSNLIRLRQATGHTSIVSSTVSESAKIDRLKQIVKELADNNQKCIVFSNWTKMTDILQEELSEYNPAIVTGHTRERMEEINKFNNDPKCHCIIGTIPCLGTGVTLTAANTVIFLDEPFNSAKFEQACDRAHRIGQKSTVTIISLITKNTIDEKIHQIVEEKRFISDAMVDNLSCADINALLNYLLS